MHSLLAGRYLAELTKQVFLDIENSKYQVSIELISINQINHLKEY